MKLRILHIKLSIAYYPPYWLRILATAIVFTMMCSVPSLAQWDTTYRTPIKPVKIPFDYINDFIVIDVKIRGFPLKFIVDTGAENTIILKKDIADLFGIEYARRIQIMGADMSAELYALSQIQVPIMIEDKYRLKTNLIVLEEDFLELDGIVGLQVHGILGASVLKNFTVELDYRAQYMTWHQPQTYTPPSKGYDRLDLGIQRNKPYIQSLLRLNSGDSVDAKLLLDSGASLSALLYATEKNQITIPEEYVSGSLGIGLGGSLMGYLGRVDQLMFGDYEFNQLISNFQKVENVDSIFVEQEKDGLIGNIILKRFDLIIDYSRNALYIKPNRNFKKKIRYDKSGLVLIKDGPYLENVKVLNVITDSPAAEAGILPGDRILKYRFWPISWVSYERLLKRLSARQGKTIKMTLERGDERFRVQFDLRDLI